MKIGLYSPTYRNVLFKEIREEKTAGGIYIPPADFTVTTHADMFEKKKEHKADGKVGDYVVIKVGPDTTTIKPGDIIVVMSGIFPQRIQFDEEECMQVPEQQIIGYVRND